MSGFFGIFYRNAWPVEHHDAEKMLEVISYWDPDKRDVWVRGSVALGHAMLLNTPESKYEHLPLEKDHLVLTMDARIDNREELAREIELPSKPLSEIGDSEFILGAYKKWGEECPKHLLGDFAFAIWDKKKQQLFFARDHVGIKQLHYYIDENVFLFSNDMELFLSLPGSMGIDICLDETKIVEYLRNDDWRLTKRTFIANVSKVLPANYGVINTVTHRVHRYWFPKKTAKIVLGDESYYVESLRRLIEDAVKVRLRSGYSLHAHLSGGLDSSGITTIAARLLKERKEALHVYNWVPKPDHGEEEEYYEWGFSKKLAEMEGMEHTHIRLDVETLTQIFENFNILKNDTADLWYEFPLRAAVKEKNGRVILSGWGGDEFASSYGEGYLNELFLQGKVFRAISKLKEYRENKKHTLFVLLKRCFVLCVVRCLKDVLKFPHRKQSGSTCAMIYANEKLKNFSKNMLFPKESFCATSAKAFFSYQLNRGHIQHRIESWAASSMTEKVEYRYPLLDKRIIEFVMTIPPELFWMNRTPRYIYRKAMEGILPDFVRLHTEKDEPRRVSIYHDLMLKALKCVLDDTKNDKNLYIDVKRLRHDANTLDLDKQGRFYTRMDTIKRLEEVSRAYLLYSTNKAKEYQ
ncbi:asparagine synthase-related protein [Sulfurovum riftiae]|uniref:asparagine synthase (glutamine-hydrolyzing) n=1 Tax=Sulfurovum riftiae TaxID=1630136 RepID=A0A151CFV9_9BACT|nr:asparagine synthase-related protein [Sulfurovum riftiae]KYJ86415.1 hypothetical protein AS592_06375 [Sulfurovum riftiae]